MNLEPAAAAVGGGGSGGGEDFTLPHRFLVIPPGISLAGSPAKFLSISTWIPPGFLKDSMDSTSFHISLHSNFHLSVDP